MRGCLKKQLESSMNSLRRAELALGKYTGNDKEQIRKKLAEEMQQCAIAVGEAIEESEGIGTATVTILEEYCELCWGMYDSQTDIERSNIGKSLVQCGNRARNTLYTEFTAEYEVFFFPYKASMWDSMESVWKAFCEMENCISHVVPIPYYEKKEDGTLGNMHLEADAFPPDVPVEDFRQINLEEIRPDIVFIHNPYDGMNLLTSIHPYFYSSNIKRVVDTLVYIPYFVLGENQYEEFFLNPGIILSDKVIVQNEKAFKAYKRAYDIWAMKADQRVSVIPAEKKFLVLGSPKTDPIVSYQRKMWDIPAAWEQKRRGKKTVLYNTGVSGILNGNEDELKKIEQIIEAFSKRKDMVLWWRPHPLSENTCSSMRPHILSRYQELIQRFRDSETGIFDDTSQLHRALACADAYYGDDSSLLYLFGLTGKPIVVQNPYIHTDKTEDHTLFFNCAFKAEAHIWFSAGNFNGLFWMDIKTGDISYLGKVPGEQELVCDLYGAILKEENTLWLIPGRAERLAAYNIKEQRFTFFELPDEIKECGVKFRSAYIKDNILCMLPGDCPFLLFMDICSGQMWKDDFWKQRVEKKWKMRLNAPYSYSSTCLLGDSLWFVIHNTDILVEYEIKKRRTALYRVDNGQREYSYLTAWGNDLYLASRNAEGKLCRWNPSRKEKREFVLKEKMGVCIALIPFRGGIAMIPNLGRGIAIFIPRRETYRIEAIGNERELCCFSLGTQLNEELMLMTNYHQIENSLYLLSEDGRKQMIKTEGKVNFVKKMRVPKDRKASFCDRPSSYVYYESKDLSIEKLWDIFNYSSDMSQMKAFQTLFVNADGSCGYKIAKAIMEEVGHE